MTALFIGERGEGKTTLALFLAMRSTRVVLVFEPKPDETTEGMGIYVYSPAELVEELHRVSESGERAVIFFVPPDDVSEGFTQFCDVLKSDDPRIRYSYGGITIVIDEGWMLMTANSSHKDLERMLRLAPRNGENVINVFVLAHRPRDINPRTHTLNEHLYVFRVQEENDLDVIAESWTPSISETVRHFEDSSHHLVHYDKNRKVVEIWNRPERWQLTPENISVESRA